MLFTILTKWMYGLVQMGPDTTGVHYSAHWVPEPNMVFLYVRTCGHGHTEKCESCTWMVAKEPSTLPIRMVIGKLVCGVVWGRWHNHMTVVRTWPTHSLLSYIDQLAVCERGGAVDGGVFHVNVIHPHDSSRTTLLNLHVATHVANQY